MSSLALKHFCMEVNDEGTYNYVKTWRPFWEAEHGTLYWGGEFGLQSGIM
jgi:hypothetical protein